MDYKKEDFDKICDIFERRPPKPIEITIYGHIDGNGNYANPVCDEVQRLLKLECKKKLSKSAHDKQSEKG